MRYDRLDYLIEEFVKNKSYKVLKNGKIFKINEKSKKFEPQKIILIKHKFVIYYKRQGLSLSRILYRKFNGKLRNKIILFKDNNFLNISPNNLELGDLTRLSPNVKELLKKENIENDKKNKLIKLIKKSNSFNQLFSLLKIRRSKKNKNKFIQMCFYNNIDISKLYRPINQKYNLNVKENIFKTINTKEKAYWLGFISADGHVPAKKNMIRLILSKKDEIIIDKFNKFIGGDEKAKYYYENDVGFFVSNKIIADDIKNFGIISPKDKNTKLLNFKDTKLNLAYLMGYYDGDGNAASPVINSSCYRFLREIKKKYNLKFKIKQNFNPRGSCYSLYIGTVFIKKMLKNYKNSLERKRLFLKNESRKIKCSCGGLKEYRSKTCESCYLLKLKSEKILKTNIGN